MKISAVPCPLVLCLVFNFFSPAYAIVKQTPVLVLTAHKVPATKLALIVFT